MSQPLRFVLPFILVCASLPVNALAATAHMGQVVMGTVLQVTVVAEDATHAREMAAHAVRIARHWDDVLTTWRPEGELARLNAAAGQGPQRISADLASALATMSRLSSATEGAFDPGVGPLVAKYSRPGGTSSQASATTRINAVLTLGDGVATLTAGAMLDAGGIGKGIALDAIAAEIRSTGVTAAYLDFGGSSQLAFGTMENGGPWTLALAGLEPGVGHGLMPLEGALSTSRSRPVGDETGPIVDPRTGHAVTDPRLATCYATTATRAEACSKAFIVLGWSAYESKRVAECEVLYEDEDELHFSPGFASMISDRSDARASMYDSTAPKKIRK